jgi:hypothetical protein
MNGSGLHAFRAGTKARRTSLTFERRKVAKMTFGYVQPFSFQVGALSAIKVADVRHGVTEITLSDGRLVRATLHIKDVKPSAERLGSIDISYNVITEVMVKPSAPILPVHETVQ